ncbi:ABC transporter permease [Candidatus Bathyarchaeota archaeon]|nr:ABC transporter permease [Candidatus Bathyarchaeota archaeon]
MINPVLRNQPPSLEHLFGTDEYGRDVLSRTIWASRVSLLESLGALFVAILAGTAIGMISGYYRDQPVGYMLDRVTDVFLSVPVIFVIVFFPIETGSLKWILAVGLSTWAIMAKIVRSQVLVTREKTYIESAKALGASDSRIFLSYILPDVMGVIAANMVYIAGLVILIQTTLDFFGFKRFLWSKDPGLPPVTVAPTLSWGSILAYNMPTFLSLDTWWVVLPPLSCIVLLGLSLILVGNKVTELLNPHVRSAYELIGEI